MKRQIVLCAISLFSFSFIHAQDISKETLRWTATSFRDLDSNEDFTNSCQFITSGTKQIKWVQDNGKSVTDWNVTGVTGRWADVNKTGTFKYSIADSQTQGTVSITKVAEGWTINLVVTGGASDIRLRYSVSSFEKLQQN